MFYLHDEACRLRFALVEPLMAEELRDLEASWRTAESTRGNRALVVDIRRLRSFDAAVLRLLDRFRDGGAAILEAASGPEPNARGVLRRPLGVLAGKRGGG